VAAAALDDDLELVDGRHQRAPVDPDLSDRKLVPEVKADRGADSFESSCLGAGARAAAGLLRGLVQETHAARGISKESPGDRERDRDVPVVAARVHSSRDLRLEVDAARFGQRQCVHVRADEEAIIAAPEVRDDAGLRHARARLDPETREPFGDPAGGSRLAERELRMAMEVAAGLDQRLKLWSREVGQEFFETI
jgi:hypothetical protein